MKGGRLGLGNHNKREGDERLIAEETISIYNRVLHPSGTSNSLIFVVLSKLNCLMATIDPDWVSKACRTTPKLALLR